MCKRLIALILCLTLFCRVHAIDFYVATDGNDQNDGSIQYPFATLERARDEVRDWHGRGYQRSISVFLRGGTYYLKKSFILTAQDSGSFFNPVIYTAYKKEKVFLNGGISIPLSSITHVTDSKTLTRFKPEARKHIVQVNLKALDITDYGQLRPVGFSCPYAPSWMEVFVNKEPFQLARWPNNGFVPLGKVLEKGATFSDKEKPLGKFTYEFYNPSTWKDTSDIWIAGYLNTGYAHEVVKIKNIDSIHKYIALAQPTSYGLGSGKPYQRWYAQNIIEELDTIGEYYINRETGMLYFYQDYPINSLEVSILTEPMAVILGASNVQFRNITFECSRGIGVYMEHSSNNRIENCDFRNLGLLAVCIGKGIGPFAKTFHYQPITKTNNEYDNDGGVNNAIINCNIYNMGAGGVLLGGGNRLTLTRGNNFIENCSLHDDNRIEKSYKPAISMGGVANRVAHCELYNAPSQVILLNGNDHIIEYNNIYHVLLEVDDNGAVYYGRDPTMRGHIIRYNFLHNMGNKFTTMGVYIDDGACGTSVLNNIFYNVNQYAVFISGGSDCFIHNNFFINCDVAIHVDNRLMNWAAHLLSSNGLFAQKLQTVKFDRPPFSIEYPQLINYWHDHPQIPKHNRVTKNIFYEVAKKVEGNRDWLDYGDTNWEISQILMPKVPHENGFSVREYKIILKKYKDFEKIPFDKIGKH